MKILNLYAGIGGNRKMWGDKDEITAIEFDENIAKIYKNNFPKDNVIVTDAHKYLEEHFREYDFIWSSPPCPSHSRARKMLSMKKRKDGTIYEQNKPEFPDMKLYEEIIFLQNYYEGIYCIENVIPYYKPLIEPQKIGRHLFWSNIKLEKPEFTRGGNHDGTIEELQKHKGFDLSKYHNIDKRRILRNCVEYEIGEKIIESVRKEYDRREEIK